ncbi:MAG: RAMP superfamily CRISPR-associated protein [Bacteroidales bacterium]|nr:RAMP superfamily CRISPR-associated protein [Bacteroidales bacterium]
MSVIRPTAQQLERAVRALCESGIVDLQGRFPKPFSSYPSQFGAYAAMCGLNAALGFFSNPDSDAEAPSQLLIEAIRRYCGTDTPSKGQVVEAAVVLKVALRMFKPDDNAKCAKKNVKPLQVEEPAAPVTANLGHEFYTRATISMPLNKAFEDSIDTCQKLKKGGFTLLTMEVLAPGLIIGAGLPHFTSGGNDDFKTGLQFDYTTGLPVIPGSSVKGLLRSAYAKVYGEKATNAIFGGSRGQGTGIFADALLTAAPKDGQALLEDFITPHPDPLSDPIPIRIVRVAPGCQFTFAFRGATPDDIDLFAEILSVVGIGAKTSVGFGRLRRVN